MHLCSTVVSLVMVEKMTDLVIVMRIHSDCRHELQQLATGPALQNERIGCKIWEKLVAISQRNMENVVYFIFVPGHAGVEGNELVDQAAKEGGLRDQKEADIDMSSASQQLRQFTLQTGANISEKRPGMDPYPPLFSFPLPSPVPLPSLTSFRRRTH